MAETAKRMGRPPGEPSKVVRLPLPVAALADGGWFVVGRLFPLIECFQRVASRKSNRGRFPGMAQLGASRTRVASLGTWGPGMPRRAPR